MMAKLDAPFIGGGEPEHAADIGGVADYNALANLPDLTVYLQKSGGTMTGSLYLQGSPATDTEAANKGYVDNVGGGAFELIYGSVLVGSITSLTITGLDMENEGPYLLLMNFKPGGSGGNDLFLYFNGDETVTNYWRQRFYVFSSTVGAQLTNQANIASTDFGYSVNLLASIGKEKGSGNAMWATLSGQKMADQVYSWINQYHGIWTSTANPTSITLKSSVTNGIATGSIVKLLRVNI